MKIKKLAIAATLTIGILASFAIDKWAEANTNNVSKNVKVTICHIPPGNTNNAHTITVGLKALEAHLAHGDFFGDCDAPQVKDEEETVVEEPVFYVDP